MDFVEEPQNAIRMEFPQPRHPERKEGIDALVDLRPAFLQGILQTRLLGTPINGVQALLSVSENQL